jgi:hypothetical protein
VKRIVAAYFTNEKRNAHLLSIKKVNERFSFHSNYLGEGVLLALSLLERELFDCAV